MPSNFDPKLIAGNANRPLAEAIARRMTVHRGAHLICKHRFLAAQMIEYLTDDLWLQNAQLANSNALYLAEGLRDRNILLAEIPKANMVFARMPRHIHRHLFNAGAIYYLWDGTLEGPENELITGRFVCDWSISRNQIDEFLSLL